MTALSEEIKARIDRLRIPFNAAGVDPYGISKQHVVRAAELITPLYRR
jgi:hypothetical protein